MRLSIARLRREESELSAFAVALTSPGPFSGSVGSIPSGPTDSTAFSKKTSGFTMRLATNTAIAVAPTAISTSHLTSTHHGPPWDGAPGAGKDKYSPLARDEPTNRTAWPHP